MESTPKSRGKDRTQKQNTKHPRKKDLPTNNSALETTPLQIQDRIKGATKKAMQGLGFLHLRPTFQKLVRQHDRWKALLRAEIGKAESLIAKENMKQNRRDDKRDIGRKNEIFKHGIKGIKKITGIYNTSKPLTEVKINCSCGLKWTWQGTSPVHVEVKEARTLAWIKKCTAHLRTLSLQMTSEGLELKPEVLTDMLPLLHATQNPPSDLGQDRSFTIWDHGREKTCLRE